MSQTDNINGKELPHYQVTAGVIQKGTKILISQRRANDEFGGLWEFPGGKVEQGESLEECLIREIFEELNIQITIKKYLFNVEHIYNKLKITLHIFLCQHKKGTPECRDVQDWQWINFSNIDDYRFPAADKEVIRKLSDYL